MAAMGAFPGSEGEEGMVYTADGASTAPTTPDESSSSSPMLAAEMPPDVPQLETSAEELTARPIRNICCVGAGYVGGPTAAVIAYQNPKLRVTVVDKNDKRIRRWNSKHLPIYEPGLGDIVRIARDGSRRCFFINEPTAPDGSLPRLRSYHDSNNIRYNNWTPVAARDPNLFFSTEVAKCIEEADIVLIAVNTPTKSKGAGAGSATDMTAFEGVTSEVARYARPGAIIVEKSTVPCRTVDLVLKTLAVHRPGVHFEVLSNPEFLAAGTAMKDLMHPDRVLIGSSKSAAGLRAAESLANVYAAWVPRSRIITTNVYSSELSKLVANSMLAQRISSINSISAICEKTGADVDEIATSIGFDPRIGDKFLKAGIGFGGSCFKKDILSLVYLAESLGLPEVGEYWRQVVKMNEYQRDRFSRRVISCLNNTLVGKKITLLGYAFKANTSDTRESPALEIIKTLLEEGPKEIAIFDPCCNPVVVKNEIQELLKGQSALREDGGPIEIYSSPYAACLAAHAILITTEFEEFRNSPTPTKASSATSRVTFPSDPRPYQDQKPAASESEVLAVHKHLVRVSILKKDEKINEDPLNRYRLEPACEDDCPDCHLIESSGYSTAGNSNEDRPKEKLDWNLIALHMKQPKWLFDGKGIIDVNEMTKLGIRVESVGR
ncbi:nucleotide sugar dehydrogenase [Hypoxylon trugodes]|uniref:nucleotide sugar dehydrogenase n=1 Tax=Hypoxylon trugodes TaxID=326681 RepID=UPI0021951BE6|nr:nucleotide sugar dehydrogenase [Hypoxylon trugodes]KAI1383820.1 nucleotide sugar dehydrogenase [Hypoxylon trugodes]